MMTEAMTKKGMAERKFKRVGVLMGGPSAEHDISMKSGRAVAQALLQHGYQVDEIITHTQDLPIPAGVEAVFVAFHGTFGEDGSAQALLEQLRIPYTGSGPAASRLAFDKEASKQFFVDRQIPTPAYQILQMPEHCRLKYPLVVKPLRQGSSIGVFIVSDAARLKAVFEKAAAYDGAVLVEEYIAGHELTVGIVNGRALPVIEIFAPDGNYDFTAKYQKGQTSYVVPAEISEEQTAACQRIAGEVYQQGGCCGMSRVDFRAAQEGGLFVLENNTIPGFTETSLLPKAARAAGISFPDLCAMLMETAACGDEK